MAVRREDPGIEDPPISELEEKVLDLLEAADIPTPVCDQIVALIAKAESDKISGHGPITTSEVE